MPRTIYESQLSPLGLEYTEYAHMHAKFAKWIRNCRMLEQEETLVMMGNQDPKDLAGFHNLLMVRSLVLPPYY